MANTLTINVAKFLLDFDIEKAESLVNPTKNGSVKEWGRALAHGTGLNQADLIHWDERTLAASGNETLDLSALSNTFGTVNLARVKLLAVRLEYGSTQASSIQVGGAAATPFVSHLGGTTPTYRVRNGGFVAFFAPDATAYVAGAANNLKIVNNDASNSAIYQIVIAGSSA